MTLCNRTEQLSATFSIVAASEWLWIAQKSVFKKWTTMQSYGDLSLRSVTCTNRDFTMGAFLGFLKIIQEQRHCGTPTPFNQLLFIRIWSIFTKEAIDKPKWLLESLKMSPQISESNMKNVILISHIVLFLFFFVVFFVYFQERERVSILYCQFRF